VKVGLLSDAHGNSLGLDLCLNHLKGLGCDRLYFLGDMVGYLPEVEACFQLLDEHKVICLNGNHDAMVLGQLPRRPEREAIYLHEYAEANLSEDAYSSLLQRRSFMSVEIEGAKFLLVHGSPWDPLCEYVYADSDLTRFEDLDFDAVFMGHTHRPFMHKTEAGKLVVNVGSCGLPRDIGCLASCVIYEPLTNDCEIHRLKFNKDYFSDRYPSLVSETVLKCLDREEKHQPVGKIIERIL